MRLTVVTAVLLLVGALNTVTADINSRYLRDLCLEYTFPSCGDGWTRFDENRCVKYVKTAKTFQDAQDECRSSDSDLISIQGFQQSMRLLCLTSNNTAPSELQAVWIGAKRSGENFAFTDGSEFNYKEWDFGRKEDCINMNFKELGKWNDVPCSNKNYFVCSKKSKEAFSDMET